MSDLNLFVFIVGEIKYFRFREKCPLPIPFPSFLFPPEATTILKLMCIMPNHAFIFSTTYDWGQEKGTTEDEMAGWHHGLDGRESE